SPNRTTSARSLRSLPPRRRAGSPVIRCGSMAAQSSEYLYTLALLGMTFMGFAAIVMLLRQTLGGHVRAFDVLFARVYMEFAVIVVMGAMLPPLLTFWALPTGAVWCLSSGLVAAPLLAIAL